MGYIVGAVDMLQAMEKTGGSSAKICIPEAATLGQVSDTVKTSLRQHAQTRNYTAASEIITSLYDSFPCR